MNRPTPEDWLPSLDGARAAVGVTAEQYPDDVLLSFIEIESGGDPEANRPGSQFHGLLQMGRLAGLDVGIEDTSELSGEDGCPCTEDDIEAFLQLCERYADRHDYNPQRIAVLWKGGAGTAKGVGEKLAAGRDFTSALAWAETAYGIPNLRKYVARFTAALARRRSEAACDA